ncbi:uncharacterized protein C8Q71DRAFT_690929, partial [Rhodofomes roseus]
AWREKMALCFVIACLCGIVGLITQVGVQKMLCPQIEQQSSGWYVRKGSVGLILGVQGRQMKFTYLSKTAVEGLGANFTQLLQEPGQDITPSFQR